MSKFIDPDTPATACTVQLCQGNYATCDPLSNTNIPTENLILVFSDEFNTGNRQFGVGNDFRWTAEDMYYFPTQDIEVYKPEQVMTWSECIDAHLFH